MAGAKACATSNVFETNRLQTNTISYTNERNVIYNPTQSFIQNSSFIYFIIENSWNFLLYIHWIEEGEVAVSVGRNQNLI